MRSLRSEATTLALALAVPVAVFCMLPYPELCFRARGAAERPEAFAAFVALDAEQEAQAMRRAKSAWRNAGDDMTIHPSDLIFETLPDDAPAPLVRIEDRARPAALANVPFRPSPYLPTCAAPPPAAIPVEREPPALPFSREELLKSGFGE